MRKILAFAAAVEVATGLALLFDARLVVVLLAGTAAPTSDLPLGRMLGIAILALGLACWPVREGSAAATPAFRGMLIYSSLMAVLLAYLFEVGQMRGLLLWPAVALHAAVALLLICTWSSARRATRQP